jgi:hypothetical protein
MNLSAPTLVVFLISLVLAGLALAGLFVKIPYVSPNAIWFALAGYAVLAVGNLFKGA